MAQTLDNNTAAIRGIPDGVAVAAAPVSAVSWSSILAGAFATLGVSFIFLSLGSGLGFAFVSPWPDRGMSANELTVTAAIWLLVAQWVSAGIGGYIAGRLRTRWTGTHVHEVFFRDTAHGLITWAVTTVLIVALTVPWAGSVSLMAAHTPVSAVDADLARKAAAETGIYLALSLLIGAFIASVAAAVGGRQRDLHI
jgi:hypothetical protein